MTEMEKNRKIKRMKEMYDRNNTVADIAYHLGISKRTATKWLAEYYPERDRYRSVRFNLRRREYYERKKNTKN